MALALDRLCDRVDQWWQYRRYTRKERSASSAHSDAYWERRRVASCWVGTVTFQAEAGHRYAIHGDGTIEDLGLDTSST